MAIILFAVIIFISLIVVRIGAVAFELTGLPWEQAKFQALSLFSNSGFTTKEAERITNHPARRKIATTLMTTGNAGLITLVGAFVSSLSSQTTAYWLSDLALLILIPLLIVWTFRTVRVRNWLRFKIKAFMEKHYQFESDLPEELLKLGKQYELARITIPKNSPISGKSLKELHLKKNHLQILAIEKNHKFIPIPEGEEVLESGTQLVVYGKIRNLREFFNCPDTSSLKVVVN